MTWSGWSRGHGVTGVVWRGWSGFGIGRVGRRGVSRTPWCDAPVKQTDHITSYARGGPTSERDGQGLCERCNYVKEHPDYLVGGDAGQTHVVTGGLAASSRPPAPPGHPPPTRSPIRRTLMNIEWQHALRCD
ncbi:HNH endonuclease [Flexivirga caeni]|uniref:HNH endonuclease n=1 Tax=Flexivirga caeni TaxID=2294115 RepID=UPI003CCC85F1